MLIFKHFIRKHKNYQIRKLNISEKLRHHLMRKRHSKIKDNELYGNYVKYHFAEFHNIAKHTFALDLNETDLKFTHRSQNLYLELLELIREK